MDPSIDRMDLPRHGLVRVSFADDGSVKPEMGVPEEIPCHAGAQARAYSGPRPPVRARLLAAAEAGPYTYTSWSGKVAANR